jgi:hypothetical protein
MKTIIDFFFAICIIIIFIFIFSQADLFPQSNLIVKPANVIKLSWNPSTDPDVWQYAIFYCQGLDTTLFPIKTGVDPDTLWKSEPITTWQHATVYDLKFALEPKTIPGITYLRLGVSAINSAGKYGLIRCISKVVKIFKPVPVSNVKIY